jgi:hypothetical protein
MKPERRLVMRLTTVRSLFVLSALVIVAAAAAQRPAEKPGTPSPPAERQAATVENNLRTFDVLDFDVFSNQKWDRLHESNSNELVVTWPDGHDTKGIELHIADLKALFELQVAVKVMREVALWLPARAKCGSTTAVNVRPSASVSAC